MQPPRPTGLTTPQTVILTHVLNDVGEARASTLLLQMRRLRLRESGASPHSLVWKSAPSPELRGTALLQALPLSTGRCVNRKHRNYAVVNAKAPPRPHTVGSGLLPLPQPPPPAHPQPPGRERGFSGCPTFCAAPPLGPQCKCVPGRALSAF